MSKTPDLAPLDAVGWLAQQPPELRDWAAAVGRWRHYRRTVEALKSEGWQFFQLSGPYANMTHVQAYPAFAARVEELSREEVETYMTQVAKDKKEPNEQVSDLTRKT